MKESLGQPLFMRTITLDLRERILEAFDNEAGTRDTAPRHRFSGRKPTIVARHCHPLRALLAGKNDLTLKDLRAVTQLKCSLQAINVVLARMGLTYKKRRSGPASQNALTLPVRTDVGATLAEAGHRH